MFICFLSFFFKSLFIYLIKREQEQGGGAEGEGEADSLMSRDPDMGLDPGPWDRDLSCRQTCSQLSHPGAPKFPFFFF